MENPDLIPSAELAYLGDSVIEVLVRERLVLTPSRRHLQSVLSHL